MRARTLILNITAAVFCLYAGLNFSYAQLGSWTQKDDFPGVARSGAVGFSIGSKGYIGTGYDGTLSVDQKDFWEYDSGSKTWSQKADFDSTERNDAVGFSIGSKGYIGTGYITSIYSPAKDFWEYNPAANTWTRKKDFGGTERYGAVGFSIGNKGYIGTGAGTTSYLKDFWEYDPVADTWTKKSDFEGSERYFAVGFSIGSKGYIGTGGYSYSGTNDFWEYNPETDEWNPKADFKGDARVRATCFSLGSQGYLGMGFLGSTFQSVKDFWVYDPASDSWNQIPDNFDGTPRDMPVGFAIGTKGYVGTGLNSNTFSYLNDFWEFTPSAQSLEIFISPEVQFSLLAGLPYLYSIKIKAGGNPLPNASVKIEDALIPGSPQKTLTTNANGECLYSNFVSNSVIDGITYDIKFTITVSGYPNQLIIRKIKAIKPKSLGTDEADAMGICPNKIISGNGHQIVAFSKEGKWVSWYTPSVGSWNVIPYSTSTDRINNSFTELYGAPEYEGIFAGIEIDGMFKWLWQLPLPRITHPNSNDPSVQMTYKIPFEVGNIEIIFNCHTGNADQDPFVNLQSYTIVNNTGISRNINFIYYGFIHPTVKNQNPKIDALENLSPGWEYENPDKTKAYIVDGNKIFIEPYDEEYQHLCIVGTEDNSNTIKVVETSKFSLLDPDNKNYGVYDTNGIDFTNQNYEKTEKRVNWAVKYNLGTIENNNQKILNIFSASGNDFFTVLNRMNHAIQDGATSFEYNSNLWWISQAFRYKLESLGEHLDTNELNLLKRWVITCRMLVDNESGAIIASPNRQPKYYPVWIRDAVFQAMLWELLDEQDIVDNLIGFLILISDTKDDLIIGTLRYWRQNYSIKPQPDGSSYMGIPYFPNGIDPLNPGMVEEDQMGEFLWFVYEVGKHRNPNNPGLDIPWTISWDELEQIGKLMKTRITSNLDPLLEIGIKTGLLQPSFDWYEFPDNEGTFYDIVAAFNDSARAGIGQSIVTNAAAVKGLEYCSILTGNQSYKQSASTIEESINDNFVTEDNYLSPPAYVQLCEFIENTPFITEIYSFVPSTRMKSQLNNFASVWPFKLFSEEEPFFNNFRDEVNDRLTVSIEDPSTKCFMPPYLMFALYELYHDPQPATSKLDPIVDWLSNDTIDVKYIPEVFYKEGNEYKGKGSTPLGWSNAWGALALLAKAGLRYDDLLIDGVYEYDIIDDDFNYSEINEDTLWTIDISQGCASTPGIISISDSSARFYQSGAGQCDNGSFLTTGLNIEVSDRTTLQFDVRPTFSSVDGGAGNKNDKYPVIIDLYLTNKAGDSLRLSFCYNYRGGTGLSTSDYKRIVFPDCPQDEWRREEKFLIQDYFPSARYLKQIKIGAAGWDYEGYIDNLSVYNVSLYNLGEKVSPDLDFHLMNYPNPCSNSTLISYILPSRMPAKILIYDLMGNLVYNGASQIQDAGKHVMPVILADIKDGIYFYQLEAGNCLEIKKMIVIK